MADPLFHLHQFIVDYYGPQELRQLCLDVGLQCDDLSKGPLGDQARHLILQAGRRGKLQQLLAALRRSRPVLFAQAGLRADPSTMRAMGSGLADFEAQGAASRQQAQALVTYLTRTVATFEAQMYQRAKDVPTPPPRPYKFLLPYEIGDASIFFGRDAELEALHRKLDQDRLTVLHAPSGAGKTSLLRAGLMPRLLREGRLPVYVRLCEDPVKAVKEVIATTALGTWPELLSRISLHQFLGLVCDRLRPQTRELVLILDQFEEFFAFWTEPQRRRPFIEALAECHADPSLPVRILISVRKDYFSDLAEFQDRIPDVLLNELWLGPLGWRELEATVVRPLTKLAQPVSYEPALHRALLMDLSRGQVRLPQLQIVCSQLFEAATEVETTLSLATYERLGRAVGLLEGYLERMLEQLPGDARTAARAVLKELVSGRRTARLLSDQTLAARVPEQGGDLQATLDRLVEARLLRRETTGGRTRYELAHPFMIQEIEKWIDRDDWERKRVQELLAREVAQWRVRGTLIPAEQLETLKARRERLGTLDAETKKFVLRSALRAGVDVQDWADLAGEAGEPLLLGALHDDRVQVRRAVLQGLGEIWGLPEVSRLADDDGDVRREATRALGAGGDVRAVEPLLVALRDPDAGVRRAAVRALNELADPRALGPLLAALQDADSGVRRSAAGALGNLDAGEAVEPLLGTLHDVDQRVRWAAVRSLGEIWDFPTLIRLGDEDRYVGWAAARELGELGDPRAVAPLIAALRDEHRGVRRAAADALAQLGEPAVEPLIAALEDPDWDVRWGAAGALGEMGDLRAVEPLLVLLQDEHDDVRQAAAEALVQLGGPAVERLLASLRDEQAEVPWEATEALGELGDPRAVEPLIAALSHRKPEMRRAAAEALVRLGEVAVEPLIAALQDSDPHLREGAAGALGAIGDVRAVEPLIAALQEEQAEVRRAAAEALVKIGDGRAVEPFVAALRDDDRIVRRAATVALGELGDARAVEPLIAALQDADRGVRRAAAGALVKLGRPAVDPLISALRVQNGDVRWATTGVLGEIGDPRAVEPLVSALQDKDSLVRRAAAKAMKNIGDPRAVGPLIGALWDQDSDVRWEAIEALGELGDPRATSPLIAALQDKDSSVRRAAADALRKIGTPEALAALED